MIPFLTEQERAEAIARCDRIEELCRQQDRAWRNIIRIFDNLANGRDPKDGIEDGK